MKRYWSKYINRNKTSGDCQLVTALNAYYFLTGEKYCADLYSERIVGKKK